MKHLVRVFKIRSHSPSSYMIALSSKTVIFVPKKSVQIVEDRQIFIPDWIVKKHADKFFDIIATTEL